MPNPRAMEDTLVYAGDIRLAPDSEYCHSRRNTEMKPAERANLKELWKNEPNSKFFLEHFGSLPRPDLADPLAQNVRHHPGSRFHSF
jgi:hypothetical protein